MRQSRRLTFLAVLLAASFAAAQGVRERVRVGLVTVRLEALSDGKPIADLKASDLKLRVDGRDVPIEGLDAVTESVAASPAAPAPVSVPPAAAAPAAAPAPSDSDLYLAILVDETATKSFDRRDAARQIESFLKSARGIHVMLSRFDGRLRVECPWTTDPARALQALSKIQKRTFDSRLPSPADLRAEIRNQGDVKELKKRIEVVGRRSFEAVMQMLLQFPDVGGRRALAFVSDGTALIPPTDLAILLGDSEVAARDSQALGAQAFRSDDPMSSSGIEALLQQQSLTSFIESGNVDTSWSRRMAQITNKALELDIAFYPIDSEATDRGVNPGAGSKWPGRAMPGVSGVRGAPGNSGMSARVAVTQSMGLLADSTGGQAILVPHLAADRLGKLAASRTTGYLLTFRDPSPNDFRFHRIEIATSRPGSKLMYRRGYRMRSDDERTMDTVIANLEEPSGGNPFDLALSFYPVRQESGRHVVAMHMQFAPKEAPGSAGQERDIQIWAICSDDEGNRAAPIVRSSKARETAPAGSFFDAIQLGLPPGPYTWSVAVKDVPTGVVSYAVARKEL